MYDSELLERNLHPEFKGSLTGVEPVLVTNSSCGDELLIYLKISDGKILDGRFQGKGCAISLASADTFIASVRGKSLEEASKMFEQFKEMILGGEGDFLELSDAKIMKSVSRMPARVKCAKLPWESLGKISEKKRDESARKMV